MKLTLDIEKVSVLITNSTDRITFHLTNNFPTAFPEMGYPVDFHMEARKGYGVKWVEENFKIKPEIIELK